MARGINPDNGVRFPLGISEALSCARISEKAQDKKMRG